MPGVWEAGGRVRVLTGRGMIAPQGPRTHPPCATAHGPLLTHPSLQRKAATQEVMCGGATSCDEKPQSGVVRREGSRLVLSLLRGPGALNTNSGFITQQVVDPGQ